MLCEKLFIFIADCTKMLVTNFPVFDPTLVRWGRHYQGKVITHSFNDFFGLKLMDEGWTTLFNEDTSSSSDFMC